MSAIYDWRTRAIKAEEENKKLRSELGGMRKAVPSNPMDWPLPCDVTIGSGTIKAGCSLSALVARAQALHDLSNTLLQANKEFLGELS